MNSNHKEKNKYNETTNFKLNFFSLIDQIISSILPIQYEFPLEKYETNIKEEQEYQEFIHSILIPKLEQIIIKNFSYYKRISIEQKIKSDKIFNKENLDIYKIKNLYEDESIIIKLNEKSFHEIRNDILNMLFISLINESSEKDYFFNFFDNEEYFELLPLKKIISYNKSINANNKFGIYEYKLFISFENYIKIIINPELYIQFKFWFKFFFNKINMKIVEIEYEYYINIFNENKENIFFQNDDNSKIKNIISDIFVEYLNFINGIINYSSDSIIINKKVKRNINMYLIDNINWFEYLNEKIGNNLIILKEIKYDNIKNKNEVNFENLIFNNLCLKFNGKNSNYNFNNILDKINNNKLENIIIYINNFYDFEFFEIIKNEENIINDILKNSIKIFSFLSKFLIKINYNKLKSIVLYLKGFNNNNVLFNKIKEKFDEFMKDLIRHNAIMKNIKIYFSNILNEENDNKINSKDKSDLIYSFPCLDENKYIKFNLKKKKKFRLLLFDNNINIKKNKIIDFYFFEQYSLKRIEDLCIGYFLNISELNRFLRKIKLHELCNLKKFKCFLKSNYKIKEKSLSTFFKLDWPKNTLTSIKIIFEKYVKNLDNENDFNNINSHYDKYLVNIDMFKFFESIIKEYYFKSESKDEINKFILDKHQDDFEGTMIHDKNNDKSFDLKLNIINLKKSQDKNIIITKPTTNNSNLSYIQQSNNILINSKEPSINSLLKNRKKKKFNYINDIKSVEEYHNNFYNITPSNEYQNYPLKYFYIIRAETYLKYFLNNNKKELLKNTYLFNEIVEINNIGKKTEEKYKTYLNFKKSLVIINNSITSIFALIFALEKTKNKNFKKL